MLKKMLARLMGLAALLALMGCETNNTVVVDPNRFSSTADSVQKLRETRLAAGDTIEVSVEVDGIMEISGHLASLNSAGVATLPLVGDIMVNDLLVEDARAVIAAAYARYYVNPPVVMIGFADEEELGEWGAVLVTGRVNNPGRVLLRSSKGMRLTEVIQAAGGFSPSAKITKIHLIREGKNGKNMKTYVSYKDIGEGGNSAADLVLMNGDSVYVPQRSI